MKKFFTLIPVLLFCVFSICAQDAPNRKVKSLGSWQVIPSGTEENLYCVHFANSATGYISGTGGKCLKSTDGGFNWNPLVLSAQWDLMTIWATTPDNVHIGSWDTIYNSTNGGQSWTGVYLNTLNFWVMDLQFHTQDLGYMFLQASAFKKTTDGGNTWSDMTGCGVIDDFLSGYMIDETNGFAVGGAGLMAHTIDGGQTWPIYEWNNWTEWSAIDIEGVYFTSAMNGFAVADSGVLFRTTNGGEHWSKQYIAGPEDRLKDVFFLDANLGWIVGYHGIIFSTTDGGNTWNNEPAVTFNDLNSVFFISQNLGWAVGTNGTILRFGDSGSGIGDHNTSPDIPFEISPNPVTSLSTISISLEEASNAAIDIYDLTGRMVARVYHGMIGKGPQTIPLALPDLPDGMYFCRLSCPLANVSRSFLVCH
jgi:photosystem II stability/assembly factor-like uncharacterized protein